MEQDLGARQWKPDILNIEARPTSLQDWLLIVDLSFVIDDTSMKDIIEMLAKNKT